jgi:hypothetical protein
MTKFDELKERYPNLILLSFCGLTSPLSSCDSSMDMQLQHKREEAARTSTSHLLDVILSRTQRMPAAALPTSSILLMLEPSSTLSAID